MAIYASGNCTIHVTFKFFEVTFLYFILLFNIAIVMFLVRSLSLISLPSFEKIAKVTEESLAGINGI